MDGDFDLLYIFHNMSLQPPVFVSGRHTHVAETGLPPHSCVTFGIIYIYIYTYIYTGCGCSGFQFCRVVGDAARTLLGSGSAPQPKMLGKQGFFGQPL